MKIVLRCLAVLCLFGSSVYAQGTTTENRIITSVFRTSGGQGPVTTIQYLDGLGRPVQMVVQGGGSQTTGKPDILNSTQTYDAFGRPEKLFIATPSTVNDGSYQPAATVQTQAQAFYNNDTGPFAKSEYESSPLNRISKQFGAGNAWHSNNRAVGTQYQTNTGNDVSIWTVSGHTLSKGSYYAQGALYKTVVTTESNAQVIEFKDKEGQMIEKWVQEASGYLKTTYVYDDFGRLIAVLQPELVNQNPSSVDANSSNLLFFYEYDERGRVIKKLIPGAGWTYLVYNRLDQAVLTQNERQRSENKWTFSKYDAFGRVVLSGELINAASQSTLQTNFNGHTTPYEDRTGSQFGYSNASFPFTTAEAEVCAVNYYDDYSWSVPAGFNSSGALGSQYSNVKGRLTGSKARILGTSNWIETVSYYDIRGRVIQAHEKNQFGLINRTDIEYNFSGEITKSVTGYQANGSLSTTVTTGYEYDHVGRKIRSDHQINNETKRDLANYEYDKIGRLVRKDWQKLTSGGYASIETLPLEITRNTVITGTVYDKAQTKITLAVDFGVGPGGDYTGEIIPPANAPTFADLQKIDYDYHLRGWLRGINLDSGGNPTVDANENDLFSLKLTYETDGQYNGNIGKQLWLSYHSSPTGGGAGGLRHYTYAYDPADRLTVANYGGGNTGENYSLQVGEYDKNGNIKNMLRKGMTAGTATAPTAFGNVDDLTYTYEGNRLKTVEDAVTGSLPAVIRDFKNPVTQATEYTYYSDGSLQTDANKGITSITYNYLGLPEQISLGSDYIKNTYDGSGRKLAKEVHQSSGTTYTFYDGNIVYSGTLANPQVDFITHDEGRALHPSLTGEGPGVGFSYEYHYRDHLGNLRVAVRQQAPEASMLASMEVSRAVEEERTFRNVSDTRTSGIAYEGNYSAELIGEMGPGKTFKIVAGEKITARVFGHVEERLPQKRKRLLPVPILGREKIPSWEGSPQAGVGAWHLKGGVLVPLTVNKAQDDEKNIPKAYLQLVVLDSANKPLHIEKRYLDSAALGNWQELKIEYLALQNATLQVNIVNSSERTAAYFDNLTITNDPPAIVQENHYDPWGWNLVGIETEGDPEHKWQFIDREKLAELGLNWYDLKARGYESVLGRFHSVDPDLTNQESYSTYQYGWDNPILRRDPNGRNPCCGDDDVVTVAYWGASTALNTAKDLLVSAGNTLFLMQGSPIRFQSGERLTDISADFSRFRPQSTGQQLKNIGSDILDAGSTAATVFSGGSGGLLFSTGRTVGTTALIRSAKNAVKNFDIVNYRPASTPLENHHGILDVWASNNVPGYVSRASNNPTIALTKKQHEATKGVYREWLQEKTGRKVGGKIDWSKITPNEVQALSERMLDAAKVPQKAREEYYQAFNKYIYRK